MKRCYKFVLVFLGSMFMFPTLSSAQCSYERQAELSRIANNVQFSYNYNTTSEHIEFQVNITNLTNDIYLQDNNGTIISGQGERQINYDNVTTISYNIYSKDPSCPNELISTKYVELPTYNHFSSYDDCKKNPDFELCTLWSNNSDLSDENFYGKLERYLQEEQNDTYSEVSNKSLFERIKEEYFVQTVMVGGSLLVLLIILVLKRVRR